MIGGWWQEFPPFSDCPPVSLPLNGNTEPASVNGLPPPQAAVSREGHDFIWPNLCLPGASADMGSVNQRKD